MGQIAATHRVLYVDYPYTLKDVVSGLLGDTSIPVKRILGLKKRIREVATPEQGKLYVYTPPPVLPANWVSYPWLYYRLLKINNRIVMSSTGRVMAALAIRKPIVINALNPFYGLYYLHRLSPKKIVYYCYDEIGAARWLSKHGETVERQFVKKSDAVITSSFALQQKKLAYGTPCFLVKNGVNFEMFHQYFVTHKRASPKVVGYIGSLDERLDYDMLEFAIRQAPQWQFRFIGRIVSSERAKTLQGYDNVQLLPPVAYAEVPEQISEFDVGLIPFVCNEFTRYIYPLKVNEYLAVGKPVVMTDFAPLDEFAEVAQVCASPESFLQAIHEALADTDDDIKRKRIQVAQQNSWERRTQEFLTILYSQTNSYEKRTLQ